VKKRERVPGTVRALALATFAALTLAACASPSPFAKLPRVSQREWDRSRAALAAARAEAPRDPYVLVVSVEMHEPRLARTFTARGAIAVLPGRAVRMQLVGPGGATAIDAWLSRERFRFDVPAADVHAKGSIDGTESQGLPVGFFRFWFLTALEGRLLFAKPTREGTYLVLREGRATVEMFRASRGGHVEAERTANGVTEELSVEAAAPRPSVGDRAVYRAPGGATVRVVVEGLGDEAPDPAAFEEPR
jgi:hypothetical protein